ncbi:unnamed protein product [Caenorhabditis brenneri]
MAAMKIALIILVLILTQTVCGTASMDIQSGEEPHHHHHHRHHRDTKYLETLKRKRCGPQMLDAVIDACKESCQPGSEVDISTICCSDQCDYRQIREACCPMKK